MCTFFKFNEICKRNILDSLKNLPKIKVYDHLKLFCSVMFYNELCFYLFKFPALLLSLFLVDNNNVADDI